MDDCSSILAKPTWICRLAGKRRASHATDRGGDEKSLCHFDLLFLRLSALAIMWCWHLPLGLLLAAKKLLFTATSRVAASGSQHRGSLLNHRASLASDSPASVIASIALT
jgi:hypothetical protein